MDKTPNRPLSKVCPISGMNWKDREHHDKRFSAIHEAGHLTVMVAGHMLYARAWLIKSNTRDPIQNKMWVGKSSCMGVISPAIAIAGNLAEHWEEEGELDALYFAQELVEEMMWDASCLSPTDAAVLGENPQQIMKAAKAAARYLLKHERFFRWAVAELIAYGSITDFQASEKFKELASSRRRRQVKRRSHPAGLESPK